MKRPSVKKRNRKSTIPFFENIPFIIFHLPLPCEQMLMLNQIFWALLENEFCFYANLSFTNVTRKSEAITWKHAKELMKQGYIVIEGIGGQKIIEPGEILNEILKIYRRYKSKDRTS